MKTYKRHLRQAYRAMKAQCAEWRLKYYSAGERRDAALEQMSIAQIECFRQKRLREAAMNLAERIILREYVDFDDEEELMKIIKEQDDGSSAVKGD